MMKPTLISEGSTHRGVLTDLAVELAAHSAGFRRSLPEGVLTALAGLVRAMNCYYSNLIEGHDTHPIDIARALRCHRIDELPYTVAPHVSGWTSITLDARTVENLIKPGHDD